MIRLYYLSFLIFEINSILFKGIPPKGQKPNFTRFILEYINELVEKGLNELNDSKISYLNCHSGLINTTNCTLHSSDYTCDFIHLTELGYIKYCEKLIKYIKTIL